MEKRYVTKSEFRSVGGVDSPQKSGFARSAEADFLFCLAQRIRSSLLAA